MKLSLTEENYLKAIFHLSQQGHQAVSTNAIADAMDTKPASVSDMLRKLSNKKLINYKKYQGVKINTEGQEAAIRVIRKHRLWEVFLVDKLKFNWDEVHEVAEQLEHIRSPLLIKRLDEFLGQPKFDPHGDPIPDDSGSFPELQKFPLSELKPGEMASVVGLGETSSVFLKYLDKIHIKLGVKVKVIEIVEFDNSYEVSINNHSPIIISAQIAQNLMVNY
ncbi:metal-dependent transcriptional regulator [Hyphobacterium sp. CCMP332]|nr:metal-dependent transcriptional regulator [Hyphobacterium sp. CCMP332]